MITAHRSQLIRLRATGILAAAVLLVAGSYAAAWAYRPSSARGSPAVEAAASLAPADLLPIGRSEQLLKRYDRAIAAWNININSNSGDYISATNLGTTYVGRARLTGDLADYDRARLAVRRALGIDATYLPARELRATILFAVHDFTAARQAARDILADAPGEMQAVATLGDASLELGDLPAARDSYHMLERQAPSSPVWSRLAHLAFIQGDLDRAIGLVRRAINGVADQPPSESTAFYSFQLGELYRAQGDLAGAAVSYAHALADLPGYVPAAAGLARIDEAQGDRSKAIALLREATDLIPQPEMVAALGDLYALGGDAAAAEREYALVERIGQVGQATGSVYNRQLVIFAADHDRGVHEAVAMARAELAVRPDVYGHDALAWALFKDGQLAEASAEAAAAMSLGTPDARIAYHAGLIAASQGRQDDARALLREAVAGAALLPPLQVPIAMHALAMLGGSAP
jgi:tetratricopeptide (TPR) repeat protein